MRVIVAGGTGLVGRRLVAALRAAGDDVVVLTRGASRPADESGPERVTWGRPADGAAWVGVLDGADAVVDLAGESVGGGRWTRRRRRRLEDSRLEATGALVRAMRGLPAERRPRVLVNASGVDYYGDRGEEEVDESSPPGTSFLAQLCVAWEAAAMDAEDAGVRVVVMRTGFVIARGAPALRLMALPFRLFAGGPLGGGRQWFSWIHVDDLVGLYRRALVDDAVRGPVNAVAPGAVRQRDLARVMGRVLRRPAVMPAPGFALRLALGGMADLLLHGRRARATAASACGFEFAFAEIEAALREALG